MLDVLAVQEIEFDVSRRAAEMEQKFQERYHAPVLRAMLVQAVLEDPALAEALKREKPQEWERISAQIARMQTILRAR